ALSRPPPPPAARPDDLTPSEGAPDLRSGAPDQEYACKSTCVAWHDGRTRTIMMELPRRQPVVLSGIGAPRNGRK
ncbi:MAG: hypothetical protein JW902_07915, partial [Syntrophaceae bacterium]|nr:hypothetical protein [Syntrophaceae bacterium]